MVEMNYEAQMNYEARNKLRGLKTGFKGQFLLNADHVIPSY